MTPLRIPHTVVVMVVAPAFHTNNPDGVEDAINILLFPNISSFSVSEVSLLKSNWYAILVGGGGESLN